MKEWREVYLRESSYFAGKIYGDKLHQKRNGKSFVTGFIVTRIDRGDYWIVKTIGAHAYILKKDQEYAPERHEGKKRA